MWSNNVKENAKKPRLKRFVKETDNAAKIAQSLLKRAEKTQSAMSVTKANPLMRYVPEYLKTACIKALEGIDMLRSGAHEVIDLSEDRTAMI